MKNLVVEAFGPEAKHLEMAREMALLQKVEVPGRNIQRALVTQTYLVLAL